MPVAKRIPALFLALLLPLSAAAENAVEILPTSAPMPVPVIRTDDYAFENLEPFYEQKNRHPYREPALTETEKQRLSEARRRMDAGEKPECSILNQLEDVSLSLILLPAEQYEGEEWYLILPGRELRDAELLQLVDAFREAGIRFDADLLTWHNCMRGGAITGTRDWRSDERERYSALGEQYFRAGLRPEISFTAQVTDDGIGRVTLSADFDDLFNGKGVFDFLPARRLTDDELLRIYARDNPGQDSTPNEINSYETKLRQELSSRLGMPLSAIRTIDSENIGTPDSVWEDNRKTYSAAFEENHDATGRSWSGYIELSTGKLIMATVVADPAVYEGTSLRSDIRMDPWDSRWSLTAGEAVRSLCTDGSPEISLVQPQGESSVNNLGYCAKIRITLTDDSVCEVYVSYLTGTAVWIDYYDAASAAQLDSYYDHEYGQEEVSDDE